MNEKEKYETHISELIKLSGKSANQIERELGYPRNALQNYRNGKIPKGERLIELARYFGVSPEYLLGMDELSPLNPPQFSIDSLTSQQRKELNLLFQKWYRDN